MLNVGPDGKGRVPMGAISSLKKSGEWISRHAEAIYGTSASPFASSLGWGDCTVKGNNLYLHIFDWPLSGKLLLGGLQNKIKSASFLECGSEVPFKMTKGIIELDVDHESDPLVTTLKLELDGPPSVKIQAPQMDGQKPTVLLAENSAVKGVDHKELRWMEKFGEWKHSDNLSGWSSVNDSAQWEVYVLKPGQYTVAIEYFCDQKASGFEWAINSGNDNISFVTYYSGYAPTENTQLGQGTRLRYMNLELGPLVFKSGIQTLTLSPRSILDGEIGIKRIILTPYL
jgi:alpha-L-fucosidase